LGAHSEDILSAPELSAPELRDWVNTRVGKTQRLSGLRFVQELPRSAIGKVLKRELREMYRENV
jgi:acyl-coenzyme A synthetase/AMP-(fatty) acid ligase